MLATALSRESACHYVVRSCWVRVGDVGALGTTPRDRAAPHTAPTFPLPDVGYSADNSSRVCSTRSLNPRSRIIWRSTLSTLWITVE